MRPANDDKLIRAARIKKLTPAALHTEILRHERYHYDGATRLLSIVEDGLDTLESLRFCDKMDAITLHRLACTAVEEAKYAYEKGRLVFEDLYDRDKEAAFQLPYEPSSFWDVLEDWLFAKEFAEIYPR